MDPLSNTDERGTRKPLPLSEAVSVYRKHLVPLFFMPVVFVGVLSLIPHVWVFWVFVAPLFYAGGFYAALPYFRRQAPFSFGIVACGVWMLGGIFALVIGIVIHGVFGG